MKASTDNDDQQINFIVFILLLSRFLVYFLNLNKKTVFKSGTD